MESLISTVSAAVPFTSGAGVVVSAAEMASVATTVAAVETSRAAAPVGSTTAADTASNTIKTPVTAADDMLTRRTGDFECVGRTESGRCCGGGGGGGGKQNDLRGELYILFAIVPTRLGRPTVTSRDLCLMFFVFCLSREFSSVEFHNGVADEFLKCNRNRDCPEHEGRAENPATTVRHTSTRG